MTFNTTSFFAGVGTVFAAVALGFAGGAMITTAPKVEPNRLERVMATAPATTPDASVKTATPDVRPVTAAKAPEEPAGAAVSEAKNDRNEMAQSPPAPDRVISEAPAAASQQAVPPQPAPVTANSVVAKADAEPQAESPRKARDDQLKREIASRNAERRAERRREGRKRDIDGAEEAVLQMQPDDGPQQTMPQRYDQRYDRSPRFGFFGDD